MQQQLQILIAKRSLDERLDEADCRYIGMPLNDSKQALQGYMSTIIPKDLEGM